MIPAGTGDGDEFAEWDAAYVLGALGPSDRRAYERHLAGCAACRSAVAELAGLPGLLGTISPAHARALTEEDAAPDEAVAGGALGVGGRLADDGGASPAGRAPVIPLAPLARAARRSRFRRRALGAVAASALVVAGAVGGSVLSAGGLFGTPDDAAPLGAGATASSGPASSGAPSSGPASSTPPGTTATEARTIELRPVAGADMRAEVVATPTTWGTKFRWSCHYPPDPGQQPPEGAYVPPEPIRYELVLVGRDGARTVAATWSWSGGETTGLDASTAVSLTDMDRIEITLGGHKEALATATL
ncbi:anti-sigma factor family protein [Promicromonospora sp. NPDC057488]|uniref:anti-sigma factor family protein n=1 Tax=Promicromonospora sp. NPDC057488 TaxID=3346147 RepID=UPI00366A8B8B